MNIDENKELKEDRKTAAKDGFSAFLTTSGALISLDAGHYSANSLAYLGDAVFELLVRSKIVSKGDLKVGAQNKKAKTFVNASAQSSMYHKLLPILTEEEKTIIKRGRNAVSQSRAKSASVSEYRHATGVEALFGYLYMKGKVERLMILFSICYEETTPQ